MNAEFDFKKDVVDQSFERPVLVDFWASWCGPCKILGPILEELEREDLGKWALVKIDTEAHPDISSYFRIQSIPHCKLVFEGKIVDEFTGAQSKTTIRKWLDTLLSKIVVEDVLAEPDDLDEILAAEQQIPDPQIFQQLESFHAAHPDHQKALLHLIKHEVFFNPEKSLNRIKALLEQKEFQEIYEDLQMIRDWQEILIDMDHPLGKDLHSAQSLIKQGKMQECIDIIISILHRDANYLDGFVRKVGIALFHLWGAQHPVTKENRKLFDMAIW